MRPFVDAANLTPSGTLAAGFAAVLLAADGRLHGAAAAVVAAAVLDAVDGPVARRTSTSEPFGRNLDSLADLVAFGVAPALMLYRGVLHVVPVLGTGACLAFLLAGAWRLARFPLVEERDRFLGMPIPPAGLIAAAGATLALPAPLTLAVTVVLAAVMVSTIPFPTLPALWRLARRHRPLAAGAAPVGGDGGADRASRPGRWQSRIHRPSRLRARMSRQPRRRARR